MRESNSQPTVLETSALPIELISYQVLKHRTFDCGRLCNSKSTVQTALHRCSSAIFTTKCAKVTSVLAPPNFGLLFYYTICAILSQVFCINFSQISRQRPSARLHHDADGRDEIHILHEQTNVCIERKNNPRQKVLHALLLIFRHFAKVCNDGFATIDIIDDNI